MKIELTENEILVVIKWHIAQAKKVPAKMGKLMLEERANNLLPRTRALKAIREHAEAVLKQHGDRAQQLVDELEASKKGWWNCQRHGPTNQQCTCGAATHFNITPKPTA